MVPIHPLIKKSKQVKMKASVYFKYGSPDVLQFQEVEVPKLKNDELLIRVKAATVNRTDCAMLRAQPFVMRFMTGLLKPSHPILGTDFAGEVEAIGKDVTNFKVGDRVFGFDDQGLNSHAQYMTISSKKAMATIPDSFSFEEATACLEGMHYAYNFINKIVLEPGQKVLVNGATGAIGSAALQLLKYFGAEVTAVGNTKNLDLLKDLGADKIIDYTKEDFAKDTQQYDYVFDAVGKSTFGKCKPVLKSGGTYISSELGPWGQNLLFSATTLLIGDKKVVFPFPKNINESVLLAKKLMPLGKFKAVIDKTYSLENIADAFRFVETGQKTGNVVISIN